MRYNDNILERIGEFYADLEIGKWTDFISRKPDGFDDMPSQDKMHYAYEMMIKLDEIMEDPWHIIKSWSRRLSLTNPPFDAFDMLMESELDYLTVKRQIQVNRQKESEKKHFWNRLCK